MKSLPPVKFDLFGRFICAHCTQPPKGMYFGSLCIPCLMKSLDAEARELGLK